MKKESYEGQFRSHKSKTQILYNRKASRTRPPSLKIETAKLLGSNEGKSSAACGRWICDYREKRALDQSVYRFKNAQRNAIDVGFRQFQNPCNENSK